MSSHPNNPLHNQPPIYSVKQQEKQQHLVIVTSSSMLPPTPRSSISEQGDGNNTVNFISDDSIPPLNPSLVIEESEQSSSDNSTNTIVGHQNRSQVPVSSYRNGRGGNQAAQPQNQLRHNRAKSDVLRKQSSGNPAAATLNPSTNPPPRVSSYTGLTRSTSSSASTSSNTTPKPVLTSRSTSTGSRYQRAAHVGAHTSSKDDTIAEALSAKLRTTLTVTSASPSSSPPPFASSISSSASSSVPAITRGNGSGSPALGTTPPNVQQWAASAMMNGGIASVSPDVHARILTFQQSRQSRSNSGSNNALNFTPGSIPLNPNGTPGSPSSPNLAALSINPSSQRPKDNLSRSSSSGSSTSSYSNYSRNMSSYSSPIVSPHPEDSNISTITDKQSFQSQISQSPHPLQSQRQPNLQLQIPNSEDSDSSSPTNSAATVTFHSPDTVINANPTPTSAAESIPVATTASAASLAATSIKTQSSTPPSHASFSGALFINPTVSGAKLQTQRPSLSQRRGLNLADVGRSSPLPRLGSQPGMSSSATASASILGQRKGASAPAGGIPQWQPNLNLNNNSIGSDSDALSEPSSTSSSFESIQEGVTSTESSSSSQSQTNSVLRPPGVGGFNRPTPQASLFSNYRKYVDVKSGSLNFAGKASLHSKGVDFSSGSSFRISIDEFEPLGELGRGNYGTVTKVLHKPTNVIMAMKEIRLELDETKFRQILMELEVLHKCDSTFIVDFYGAFFIEGAVYMCMEYMDGGSLNKIYQGGLEERYLAIIAEAVVRGLKSLKDQHNIIHRDVKPTNILVSTSGKVKLCDFGVSGNLVASIARTNVGCQSYMAPERIRSKNPNEAITYTVESDIWSLGLSLIEIASGEYPYPADTHNSIYSQLMAILDGDAPSLPEGRYSAEARSFVEQCLNKTPRLRPSYAQLLNHPWLVNINHELAHSPTLEIEFGAFVKRSVEKFNREK